MSFSTHLCARRACDSGRSPIRIWSGSFTGEDVSETCSNSLTALKAGNVINRQPVIVSVVWTEGALLRDWGVNRLPVYFDFGNSKPLWRLDPRGPDGTTYLSPVTKAEFLRVHLAGEPFDRLFSEVIRQLAAARSKQAPQFRELTGFDRYMARKQRTRPRFLARPDRNKSSECAVSAFAEGAVSYGL